MNKCLLLLLCLSMPCILAAQDNTFDYYRKGKYVQMSNGNNIVGFESYQTAAGGKKERAVQARDMHYRLVIQKLKSGKIKTVVNAKDSVLATVLMSGDNTNDLLLPDGRTLERVKLGYDRWSYQSDGRDVITYTIQQEGKSKRVIVHYADTTMPIDALQIICLEHCAEMLYSNPTALMIGVGVGLALLRVAVGSGG